ncbi:MAG: fluoride efflux transporter CrcB [Solirubrobacteraceae bacterium]|nr:fluoride efflux transporter CrcB [Solirubrobacteraceae bacterium]
MSAAAWIGVALAGGAGALARYAVGTAVMRRAGRRARGLPVGTLAVNLSGALALGALAGAGLEGDALAIAGTGLLGSYTTFSTWMLETERLAGAGRRRAAAANVAGSLALGLAAVAIGRALA